ncbi:hypothetical protein ACFLIM_27335 [Nonomuraea sp. M3C6]|uniref:Uncharacterized protein n=1 Tax=Nonomuraea marmarensis TaxID=3351344 RepID=A0ABW7AHU6_9ACTN
MNTRSRPRGVVTAATLQLLTAVPFLIGTFDVLVLGAEAQAAAEAEVVRQGFPAEILSQHSIDFGGKVSELPLAVGMAVILAALAALNLAGNRTGRILSWIFHPILFVLGCVIVSAQVFTAQFLESSFKSDPVLARIDVPALMDATMQVIPGWLLPVNVGKLILTTLGSLLVVVLLALPLARAYFRKSVAS